MRKIIVISGPVSSGKSRLAENLEKKFGAVVIKTKDVLQNLDDTSNDRLSLQKKGDKLDRKTNGRWVRDKLSEIINVNNGKEIYIVDSVRVKKQIDEIRKSYTQVIHLHLTAPVKELKKRYSKRYKNKNNIPTYQKVRVNKTEKNIGQLEDIADVVIDTDRCREQDILVRAASRMCLYGNNSTGYVDVLVGGEFGSEGKGQIVAYIAKEYDLLIRVGGPNAGHKIPEEQKSYTHYQLPSGTKRSNAHLLLGPGMVINVEKLLKEISECDVDHERLSIDPQAMIIEKEDIQKETKTLVKSIGSTGQGVGRATSRKILRGKNVRLARDVPVLKPFIRPAIQVLEKFVTNNGRILLEGTQGTGLSIHHGYYPHVTSRDTIVSGCLADVGLPPSLVRRIIMVSRTYPIRVQNPDVEGNTSGPMSQEITLKEIHKRSGKPMEELENTEITSTTKRKRRIGEFDWELIKNASFLNGPTDIALTFTDYIDVKNNTAQRFEQLTPETINFIEEIEHVTRAKVSLIATGFSSRSVIDRREW